MNSKVIQIDCIEGLRALQEPVSVIVTSPPYNIGLKYKSSDDRRKDYLEWMRQVFVVCKQALADHGHFFLQVGGTSKRPMISSEVLAQALEAGFVLQNDIIWVKNISLSERAEDSYGQFKPVPGERYLNNTYEHIFHLTKTGLERVNRLGNGVNLKWESNVKRFNHGSRFRCRGLLWFIPYETIQSKAEKHHHPAIFPVMLPEMCIKMSGIPKGSLVVDPFVGTGSTLIACERLKMRGIGFDISSEYCKAAEYRLLKETQI
jgi:site-specific DNA-methyltransferase (adenine-specific)